MSDSDHLTEADFECLLHGRASRALALAAHHHLLQCRRCRADLFVYDEALAGLHLDDMYGAGAASCLRRQLESPVDTLSYLAARDLDMGAASSAHELYFRVVNSADFQDVGSLTVVIERAHALRKDSPQEANLMLQAAIRALEGQTAWPTKERAYLLTLAWCYFGNVQRILYDLDESRESFRKARKQLKMAGSLLSLGGEVAWMEGFFYKEARDFTKALPLLKDAAAKFAVANDTAKRVEVEITLAHVYGEAGFVGESIARLEALIESVPAAAFPPTAFLACLQSLIVSYAQTGQPAQARDLLPKIRRLAKEEGNRLDLLRVQWAEAEVYKSQGNRILAAAEFREVTSKFLAAQIPVDAALAALSQADMYLTLGDTKAAAELAEVLVPIFQSKGIHREATEAGLIVVQDLRREAATAGQVQKLVERLQRRPARRRG